jgi:2-octaprenyl-6-methoxyphenol hydroxylase
MRVVDLRGARGPVTRDFRAGDVGEESFGFNVPNRALQGELEARIAALPHVELRRGVAFRARAPEGDRVRVALTEGEATARLLVGADGRDSPRARGLGHRGRHLALRPEGARLRRDP